jgi:hypothetical protein
MLHCLKTTTPHLILVDQERFKALQPILKQLKDLGVGPVRPDLARILRRYAESTGGGLYQGGPVQFGIFERCTGGEGTGSA